MRTVLLLLAMVVPAAGWCQGEGPTLRIEPGSAHLVAGRVPAGTDTLVIATGRGAAARIVGLLYLETRSHEHDGAGVLTRVEWIPGSGDDYVAADSFVLVRTSLAPLSAAPLGDGDREHLRFGPDHVVHGGVTGAVARVPVEGSVFYGNSMDLVLRSLPLRRGLKAVLPVYEAGARASSEARIVVEALEEIRSASGEACPAWRIRVDSGEHGGTYWIDSRSHALVRYQASPESLYLLRTTCGDPPPDVTGS